MGNVWTDQPLDAEGSNLIHLYIGDGYALQIQQVEIGAGIVNYSVTVGNLFGSKTFIDAELPELLKTVNAYITRLRA